LHGGSSKVEDPVLPHDLDIDLPVRVGLVCSDQLSRVAPHLDPDVDVAHGRAVSRAEHMACEVDAGDRNSHTPIMPAAWRLVVLARR
jgi:hypothetical protein